MGFQIGEEVEEGGHAQLVEQDDDEQHDVDQGDCPIQSRLLMTWVEVILFDGTHHQLSLRPQDEVENDSNDDQHQKA